jgi:hypothetical protein
MEVLLMAEWMDEWMDAWCMDGASYWFYFYVYFIIYYHQQLDLIVPMNGGLLWITMNLIQMIIENHFGMMIMLVILSIMARNEWWMVDYHSHLSTSWLGRPP